jgi:putative endonuclease
MSRQKGDLAEKRAVDFLEKNGFLILDANFYSKFGEIDIVALKDDVLHFIEVKSGVRFDPIYNITPTKMQKIIRTVDYYLLTKKLDFDYCIDAVLIRGSEVELLENIGF